MKAEITPSKAFGSVCAPPSKSISHRELICGALSKSTKISGIAYSNDIKATLGCLEALGAKCSFSGDRVSLGGLDPANASPCELFCDESGSTLRFMLPLCLLSGSRITLKGSPRLFERPLGIYQKLCESQNILYETGENSVTVCGRLKSGNYDIPGNISSQFITGLLFALPLLKGESVLNVIGKFESASYVDITLGVLSSYGIDIIRSGNSFIIPGNQTYQSREAFVEGDCSNAAFLEALNFLGGNAEISGIPEKTLQGDRVYRDIFKAMNQGEREFDLSDCPDLAPILFSVAAVKGKAVFNGTARLKIKESDRAEVMAQELKKFGAELKVEENRVTVSCLELKAPSCELCGHNDHRIVMSLAVLATLKGGVINGAEAVSKSYPDFFETLKKLNIGVTLYEA
ncbi:MAG: 3-phosphoshikimate 1-carboxyvinyltransferase [Clostridia bacterium]|nr:3-phosphoshikimate 1-carboxyvinyltransferase [Clostridia bacterium]